MNVAGDAKTEVVNSGFYLPILNCAPLSSNRRRELFRWRRFILALRGGVAIAARLNMA